MNGDGDENGEEKGGEREPRNLRHDSNVGLRRERGLTGNRQPQPKDSTPQRDHGMRRRTIATQGQEAKDRTAESGGGTKIRLKPLKRYRCDEDNKGTWAVGEPNVAKRAWVQ